MHKLLLATTITAGLAGLGGCCQSNPIARGQNPGYSDPQACEQYGEGYCPGDECGPYGRRRGRNCDDCCPPHNFGKHKLYYPDQNALPGMVQYPYYTVKGPDCFFHQ